MNVNEDGGDGDERGKGRMKWMDELMIGDGWLGRVN
jgi:hypothetical protein